MPGWALVRPKKKIACFRLPFFPGKICIPKIFIGPSKISAQFSVHFQNFTEKYSLHLA